MKTYLVLILSCLVCLSLYAQKGKFYLTHYSPDNEQITNENFSIVQDSKQQMLFANSKGVLKFDGRFWQLVNTPGTVLSISNYKNEEENYVGCINDIGYIKIENNGTELYKSIADYKNKPAYFSKVVSNADYVYFLGQEILIQYSKKDKKPTKKWETVNGYNFTQLFNIDENIFVYDVQQGFFKMENGKLAKLNIDISTLTNLAFIVNADQKRALIGTSDGKLFFFNGLKINELKVDDAEYLKNSIPFDAVMLNPNLLAVATSKGGVVLLNPVDGKGVSIVNFYSGLPDDEVYSIGKDNQSGLWMAHEYGFSRLDYFLPFRNFSVYPGLEGNITSSLTYQNKLYTGTNEGLFYLDKVTDFVELAKVLKKSGRSNGRSEKTKTEKKPNLITSIRNVFSFKKKKIEQTDTLPAPAIVEKPIEKKEKKFLGIFKRRKKEEALPIAPIPEKVEKVEAKKIEKPLVIKKPVKRIAPKPKPQPKIEEQQSIENFEMQTVKFAFQKVKGIEGKVRHLSALNKKLIVATNNGLYEISGTEVKKICIDPVSYLYISKDKKLMYVATDQRSILGFRIEENDYVKIIEQSGYKEKISGITEDNINNVWLSFDNFLIKYERKDLSKADTILLENPFSEKINLVVKNDRMYFLLNSKAYYYNESKKTIISDTSFLKENGGYLKIIHSEASNVWYQSADEWKLISRDLKENQNFVFLSLIKDISQIYVDENKIHLWVTTKSNNLYQFDISNKADIKFAQNIFLRSLSDKQGNPLDIKQIELSEESGNVSFSFANPEYIDNQSLKYQYQLMGLNDTWSEWNGDNRINFNYLPSGNYELKVRTKNSLNQIRESTPLSFKVHPPYWKEWWFYLGELVFFGSLLLLSIWLNNLTHQKNEWISKGLTFLTIVMMIEFINTVFESYLKLSDTPVLSFLVQVFLAILILPFERVLSKFITHDSKQTIAAVKASRKPKKKADNSAEGDRNQPTELS